MQIKKVTSVPQPDAGTGKYLANTLYFVRTGGRLELHLTSSDGSSISHIPTQADILSSTVAYQDTAPALPNEIPFWMNTTTFTLYVQYDDGRSVQWVEAIPSYHVPEFAGTGEANTMARSDHNHDETYAKIGAMEW
jgi:hypothetical protein